MAHVITLRSNVPHRNKVSTALSYFCSEKIECWLRSTVATVYCTGYLRSENLFQFKYYLYVVHLFFPRPFPRVSILPSHGDETGKNGANEALCVSQPLSDAVFPRLELHASCSWSSEACVSSRRNREPSVSVRQSSTNVTIAHRL